MKQFFILFLLIFFAQPSSAAVYKWVDDKGIVHFTDDITHIPETHRSQAEKIGLPDDKVNTKTDTEPIPRRKEDTYMDQLGRGEEYWKARVEEWKKKLSALQGRVEALRINYNGLTEKFNDSKSSVERASLRKEREQIKTEMDQCRIQIEEAREMLGKKIPEEANLYKAKPEWVKQ